MFGEFGTRLPFKEVVTTINAQMSIFEKAIRTIKSGGQTKPAAKLSELIEIISIYEYIIDAGEGYDVGSVVNRLIGLPMSLAGNYIVPTELVVEFGLAATATAYPELYEDDEPDHIRVCRPNAKVEWRELLPVLAELEDSTFKDHDDPWESAKNFVYENWQVFPGGIVACPGWKEGINGEVHRCSDLVEKAEKELYHRWRCPDCNKAYKAWRRKGTNGSTPPLTVVRRRTRKR